MIDPELICTHEAGHAVAHYMRLSTAYQLGMPDGRTGAYGCHVSDRHGLADTFRCVADVRAG